MTIGEVLLHPLLSPSRPQPVDFLVRLVFNRLFFRHRFDIILFIRFCLFIYLIHVLTFHYIVGYEILYSIIFDILIYVILCFVAVMGKKFSIFSL